MGRPKILVVDDDAELLQSLSLRLRHEGFDVAVAMDGYQGLERARRESPDLLILDIHMPAGDGFSVQDRLQELMGPWPTVIYLTGDRSLRTDLMAKKLGAFAVIRKPFDIARLLETVRHAVAVSPGAARGPNET